ncbi:MAG: UbiD family decarboxylase, partial [Dehalococcoidia bacterium]|nr:UbiD family decarboxylase [Dehalococcoidia bacterium]
MSYKDVRGWIDEVDRMGQLKRIQGADWDLEIGALVEIISRENKNRPALLFDNIRGYPPGYRVLSGLLNNMPRLALTAGLSPDISGIQFVQEWRTKLRNLATIPPMRVNWGPVMENVMTGDEVDLLKFPTPKWHEGDGGRYIGTAGATITKDPDSNWINLATYRVMVHDKNTLGFFIAPGKHGRIHREKYFAMNKPCPVAISFGHDPLYFMMGSLEMPLGACEYDIIGGLKGEPIEVLEGEFTGLPIPANAEIVIEGESLPAETMMEGPFGEFPGYYGSAERPEPFIRVKRVLYRNNPVMIGAPPFRPPDDTSLYQGPCTAAVIWENMEKAGVPDIRGVWQHEAAPNRSFI